VIGPYCGDILGQMGRRGGHPPLDMGRGDGHPNYCLHSYARDGWDFYTYSVNFLMNE